MKEERWYESIIHTFTIFFYVLMSLGLKELLGGNKLQPDSQRWLCFIAALLLLMRFLFGTASHLAAEPAKQENLEKKFLFWHLCSLIIFALIGTKICFCENVTEFLRWNAVFGVAAFAAALGGGIRFNPDQLKRDFKTFLGFHWKEIDGWEYKWMMINAAHAIISLACLQWYKAGGGFLGEWSMPLIAFFVSLALLLYFDVTFQIHKLYTAQSNA